MASELTQRELRNSSGEVMRALDRGEEFVVTRNGTPVGRLTPVERRRFIDTEAAFRVLATLPAIDADELRHDLDLHLDQDPTPGG